MPLRSGYSEAVVRVTLPNQLLGRFLQHIRDFDSEYDKTLTGSVEFTIGVNCPEITAKELERILSGISPPFGQIQTLLPGEPA
jgi:hypothetical protein